MRIKRFTRDEQAHDFARALEDRVHAAISKKSLHSDRRLASSSKRMRSFVAATTAHLHRIIGDSPGRFSRPHFAHGCFDAQIARFTIEQRRGVKRHRFHREHISGHFRYFSGDRGMFANGHAPLDAFACPFARDFEQPFGKANARCGQCEAPGVQRCERNLQAHAFLADHVLGRHAHVREAQLARH